MIVWQLKINYIDSLQCVYTVFNYCRGFLKLCAQFSTEMAEHPLNLVPLDPPRFEVGERVKARYEPMRKHAGVWAKIDWGMFPATISGLTSDSYIVHWDGNLAADSVVSAYKIKKYSPIEDAAYQQHIWSRYLSNAPKPIT